jgi:hypothetical protein
VYRRVWKAYPAYVRRRSVTRGSGVECEKVIAAVEPAELWGIENGEWSVNKTFSELLNRYRLRHAEELLISVGDEYTIEELHSKLNSYHDFVLLDIHENNMI